VPNELKPRVIQKVFDVLLSAGKKVVESDNLVTLFEKPIGQVGAQKTRTAGNEHALSDVVGRGCH
jgi:hypothetical protein